MLSSSKQQAETVKNKLFNRVEHEALKELLKDECIKSEIEEKILEFINKNDLIY